MTASLDVAPSPRASSSPWLPAAWRVRSVRQELADTVSLDLEPPHGATPVSPRPGQFNMLWAFGVGEVPISVSGLAEAGVVRHTIRAVGAVTDALCSASPGDVVGLRGPYGAPWSIDAMLGADGPRDLLIVAGGLGLAPLRPVVLLAAEHRDHFRHVRLLQGARSPAQLLFADEFEQWESAGIDVRLVVDHADDRWDGPIGVVTALLAEAVTEASATSAIVCGPEVMMRFVGQALVDRGVPPERLEVSLERNMACGMGICGHCQLSSVLICRDGPVLSWPSVEPVIRIAEL